MPASGTPLVPYVRGPSPTLKDTDGVYTNRQFERLKTTVDGLMAMTPQPAVAAPKNLYDGMIRLSRSPWRPIGGVVDAWVYWDATVPGWVAL